MRGSLRKFPDNLPCLVSAFAATPCFVFLLTATIAKLAVGRPGSTPFAAFGFIPVFTAAVALAFYALGHLFRVLVMGLPGGPVVLGNRAVGLLKAAFALAVAVPLALGWMSVEPPHVDPHEKPVLDKGVVNSLLKAPPGMEGYDEARLVLRRPGGAVDGVVVGNRAVTFRVRDRTLDIYNERGRIVSSVGVGATTNRITQLLAVPVGLGEGREGLAVLASMSPDTHLAVLLVYDERLELVYEESMERAADEPVMQTLTDAQGSEVLYVNAKRPLYYSMRH